jgi:RNA polymerase II subunit A small phosphatase-like protein
MYILFANQLLLSSHHSHLSQIARPTQIEDVVHFVYVAKRPGVDEFLTEMAKHYEMVIYTASLNKYADPLLDLLDPNRVIRTRLFRESCVFYEGNYVKDMSLINRDLSQAIIIDNSPSSYLFHPENAIDCSSFIDDPSDRELDQIGKFLVGIKDVDDVRGTVNLWRHWPNVDLSKSHKRINTPR